MTNPISIKGIDKDELLAALFNKSFQQGMGVMHQRGAHGMSVEQACEILDEMTERREKFCFDYLHGRVMKIDISGDEVYTGGYDRDVGEGAVASVIETLRAKQTSK